MTDNFRESTTMAKHASTGHPDEVSVRDIIDRVTAEDETAAILADPDAMAAIDEAEAEL